VHRRTTVARGYGPAHKRIREQLKTTLPAPCGYGCGRRLEPDGRWVAAHRVDGHPELGYIAACDSCNEGARGKGGIAPAPTPSVEDREPSLIVIG
jgi:hypothetical protein